MTRCPKDGWSAVAVVALAMIASVPARAGDQEIIDSAMAAAPAGVAAGAAIMAMESDGTMRMVREGDNGFTCIPDNPATPGPDPMCADAFAMEWVQAWVEHREPPKGKVGFMFMLEGGTDASNTDPYAAQPTEGNHWISTGPHVMIVGAAGMMADYPRGADPDTSMPYVMWADTPYEHLMIPVR